MPTGNRSFGSAAKMPRDRFCIFRVMLRNVQRSMYLMSYRSIFAHVSINFLLKSIAVPRYPSLSLFIVSPGGTSAEGHPVRGSFLSGKLRALSIAAVQGNGCVTGTA